LKSKGFYWDEGLDMDLFIQFERVYDYCSENRSAFVLALIVFILLPFNGFLIIILDAFYIQNIDLTLDVNILMSGILSCVPYLLVFGDGILFLHLICRHKPIEYKFLWGTAIGLCIPFLVLFYYLLLRLPLISNLNAIVLCMVTVILIAAVFLRERQIGEKLLVSKANISKSSLALLIVFVGLITIQVFLYTMLKVEYSDGYKHAVSISIAFSDDWMWNNDLFEIFFAPPIVYSPGYALFSLIGTSFSNSPFDGLKGLSFASWLVLPFAFIPLANKVSKRRLNRQEAALISLILLASPWVMMIASLNLQDGFLVLLTTITISLVFNAKKKWQFFIIGTLLGIAYLTRGFQAVFALFAILIILTSSQLDGFSEKFKSVGYMILGGFITFLPWGIRTFVLYGSPFYSLQGHIYLNNILANFDPTTPFIKTVIAGLGRYVSWLLIGDWSFFSLIFFAFFAILLSHKIKRKELDKTVDLRTIFWLLAIFTVNIILLSFFYSRQERYLTTILPLFFVIFYGVLQVQSKERFVYFGIWTGWSVFHTLKQTKDYWYYVQGRSVNNLLDIFPDQPYRLPYENLVISFDHIFYFIAFLFILIFALYVFYNSIEIGKIDEHPKN
jgi:4-amino-4-deoxy-L-arabinose transferase-like glycosyltransferase